MEVPIYVTVVLVGRGLAVFLALMWLGAPPACDKLSRSPLPFSARSTFTPGLILGKWLGNSAALWKGAHVSTEMFRGDLYGVLVWILQKIQPETITWIQLLFSHPAMPDCLWPHGLQHTRLLSFTISWSLLKLMSVESVIPSNHLVLCYSLFLLPSIFLSIRIFSSESDLRIRWSKYWSFSFSISPSSGLEFQLQD